VKANEHEGIRKHLLGSRAGVLITPGSLTPALPRPGVQKSSSAPAGRFATRVRLSGAKGSGAFALCLVPVLALAVFATSAAAASYQRPFKETFGTAEQPTFGNPQALAFDQTSENLYAFDAEEGKLYKFDVKGSSVEVSALGSNAIDVSVLV
jgi:hypothetical protein